MASSEFLTSIRKQIVDIGYIVFYEYYNPISNDYRFINITNFVKDITTIRYDQQSLLVGAPSITLINSEILPDDFYNRKAITRRVKIFFGANRNLNLVFEGRIYDITFTENVVELVCKDIFFDLFNKLLGSKTVGLTNKNKVVGSDTSYWDIENPKTEWLEYLDDDTDVYRNAGHIAKSVLMTISRGETEAIKEDYLESFVDTATLVLWTSAISDYEIGVHFEGTSVKDILTKIAELTNSFIWISNNSEEHPAEQRMVINFLKNYDSIATFPQPTFTLDKSNIVDITFMYETDPLINEVKVAWGRVQNKKIDEEDEEKIDYSYSWSLKALDEESEDRNVFSKGELDPSYVNFFTNNSAEYEDDYVWHDTQQSAQRFADTIIDFMSFPRRKVEIKTNLQALSCGVGSVVRIIYPLFGLNNVFRINRMDFDLMSGSVSVVAVESFREVPTWRWNHIYEIDTETDYPQEHGWSTCSGTVNYSKLIQYSNSDGTPDYTYSNINAKNLNDNLNTKFVYRWLNGWVLKDTESFNAWLNSSVIGKGETGPVVFASGANTVYYYKSLLTFDVSGHYTGKIEPRFSGNIRDDGTVSATLGYFTPAGFPVLGGSVGDYNFIFTDPEWNEKIGYRTFKGLQYIVRRDDDSNFRVIVDWGGTPIMSYNIKRDTVEQFSTPLEIINFNGVIIKELEAHFFSSVVTGTENYNYYGALINPIISLIPELAYIEQGINRLQLISMPFYEYNFPRLPYVPLKGTIQIKLNNQTPQYGGGPTLNYPFTLRYINERGIFSYDITVANLPYGSTRTITMCIDCSTSTNLMSIYVDNDLIIVPTEVFPSLTGASVYQNYDTFCFGWSPTVVCTHQTENDLRYIEVESVKLKQGDCWTPEKEI